MVAVAGILKQQKRAHKTIDLDPHTISGTNSTDEIRPGDRGDNRWHLYDSKTIPDTQEKWDKSIFIEKTHWGYYTWPR